METKTDMEPDIHLTVQPTMTVSEVQKEVEKRMGWLPTSQLKRMEGFKDPWESAVFKGRLLAPDKALQDSGIASGDMIITVRRVLVPEGWKIVKEGEDSDYTSSDEDW
ncbi:g11887 [Coccomyxa viridis]|uniref:G11887 protein n=1 Tax=Coccomyxa viridis TaxID=1274662 RepID=A0ABP1G917_9CHLO